MSRKLSQFEERRGAQLAEALEAAEEAIRNPTALQAKIPLSERRRAEEKATEGLAAYLNNLVRV